MNAKTVAGLSSGVALVLLVSLVLFLGIAEEEKNAACDVTAPAAVPAVFVDPATVPAGPIAGYRGEQLVNAAAIMLVARERGLTARDQQIGVMTAMGESSLRNPDHGDKVRNDTVGLFQIGPEHGALEDRMTPSWAAGNFYDRLLEVGGYETLQPTIAAHRAQRNADPYHYQRFWASAGQVLAALGGVEQATTVPASTTPASSYSLGPVQPQLANMVNVLGPKFGIETVGGYRESGVDPAGHPAGLAADFMVPTTSAGRAQGEALAAYAMAHAAELKIDYILWYQRIWSQDRAAEGWRPMSDRGSPTANHVDHVHINVLPDGAVPASGGVSTVATAACAAVLASSSTWVAPLDAPVTSPYGPRTNPYTGEPSFHDGVDYGAPCGTPVKGASAGTVISAGPDIVYGYQVVIDHGGGIVTKYGHMAASGVLVGPGETVTTGAVIATVGSEGWSTGCHLHLTVEVDGKHTDPIAFLANPPTVGGLGDGISVAHANIKFNLPAPAFRGDLATTTASGPDLLSLNEVGYRSDAELAPPGYQAFRAPGGNSQARSTAVAWRSDRWRLVDGGRLLLVDDGPQQWDAGRSATWATVQDADGAGVSIISVHHMINPAKYGPNLPERQRLYAEGMRRLQALVSQLGTSGPVFIAGDFNSQYSANDPWGPRAMLGAIGMRATFDTHGALNTHDGGGTIDYIFHETEAATTTQQVTRNLNSDHHALISAFTSPQE